MNKGQIESTLGRSVPDSFMNFFNELEASAWVKGRHYQKWWLEDMLWEWLGEM